MLLLLLLLVSAALGQDAETCGDVKLFRQELPSPVSSKNIFYINDATGDDENFIVVLTDDGDVLSSLDGGLHWLKDSDSMTGLHVQEAPFYRGGVNHLVHSADGSNLWATSFKSGFWRRTRESTSWTWTATGTDILVDLVPHPTQAALVLGVFRTQGCYNSSATISCKSALRLSRDSGVSWTELSVQCIQVAWSLLSPNVVFFSEHTDPAGNYNLQSWYDSQLKRGLLGASGGFQSVMVILDHQSGMAYKNGTLLAAQRVSQDSNEVYLYTSSNDAQGGKMDKAIFRNFFDNEVAATSFNVIDLSAGSIFVNVRTEKSDRGDLYVSSALDHDFELVLPDNVRGGMLGDVAKVGSIRGVYIANVFVPPDDTVVTGITYDNGANWDFINVPDELKSRCNNSSPYNWCGMHFLGRSNSALGLAPYSAPGAIGLAMATGNVGNKLALDAPDEMATFLSRDAGVSWKQIASGNNLYSMADRGAILVWAASDTSTPQLYWSWDEGKSSSACAFGQLGQQTVHALSSSPSHDGFRFHLITSAADKSFIVTVDFSNLADGKCTGEDAPDTPGSNYETWTAKNPDGEQGCILGSLTTYVRRKQAVQCFNADNDIVHSSVSCNCDRSDYECDDCYELEQFWVKGSKCVKKTGPCNVPDPCAGGNVYFNQTRGYRKIPSDICSSTQKDVWAPLPNTRCDSTTTTSSTSTKATTSPPVGTTSSTSKPVATSSSQSGTPNPTTNPVGGPNWKAIIGVVLVLLLIGGLVGTFLYLRRKPSFQARWGGRLPFVPRPEDPYSTLGELDTSGADDMDF